MRDHVKFQVNGRSDHTDTGYPNSLAECPIDVAAKLVLSSTWNAIERITLAYDDGYTLRYNVVGIVHHDHDYPSAASYVAACKAMWATS